MLGHQIEHSKPKAAAATHQVADGSLHADRSRELVLISSRELNALSRRGLWGIILFLALSAFTLYASESGLCGMLPGDLREIVSEALPIHLVHIVLGASWLSALILILGRMTGDAPPGYNWYNVGLPTVLYPLYVFADPTGGAFPVVFAAGLVLLLVEHWSVMRYIREERGRVGQQG